MRGGGLKHRSNLELPGEFEGKPLLDYFGFFGSRTLSSTSRSVASVGIPHSKETMWVNLTSSGMKWEYMLPFDLA